MKPLAEWKSFFFPNNPFLASLSQTVSFVEGAFLPAAVSPVERGVIPLGVLGALGGYSA